MDRQDVSFKTIDGLTLRGWLYPIAHPAPAIIITPGLPCVKEMFIPALGEAFQVAGINALLYDPRHCGESDGTPRNEIDPAQQVSDYSDALSFLAAQPSVDNERIAAWGMSFSATIALCAAALDKRFKLCIAAAPFVDLKPPPGMLGQVLKKCAQDRASRLLGNEPTYLPMLTATGKNPAGLSLRPTEEELEMVQTAQQRGAERFGNRCTLETYYNFVRWGPEEIMKMLPPTPVLFIVPEEDTWCLPERQKEIFEGLKSGVKRLHSVPGKGHFTLFNGEDFGELMGVQASFLVEVFWKDESDHG